MANANLYSLLPKVDELLEDKSIQELLDKIPRSLVLDVIRQELDTLRASIRENKLDKEELKGQLDGLVARISRRANQEASYKFKRVINATGVIIHTNLGRSLLNDKILDNIKEIARNYSNLEYDLQSAKRGSRYSIIESLICEITGAEAALVVNNNAAAVLLALSTLAKGREVIVSRGELIEIGGSFRIPEVMEESGAILREVGTTNKTHLRDYENVIGEETAALLKVHTSNYRILGFTSSVSIKELVDLKTKYQIPLIEDLGSGVLVDLAKYGLNHEPTVQESLANGADVVTFSGDKLLGGPQAGIILGKKEHISLMKQNPLTRAIRVDKFTLAALEVTLRYYLDEERALREIPTLRMLTMPIAEIEAKAKNLLDLIEGQGLDKAFTLEIQDDFSEVGGGSLPLEELATKCLVLSSDKYKIESIEGLLRGFNPPIITRIYRDRIYFDLRTIKEGEFKTIVEGLTHVANTLRES